MRLQFDCTLCRSGVSVKGWGEARVLCWMKYFETCQKLAVSFRTTWLGTGKLLILSFTEGRNKRAGCSHGSISGWIQPSHEHHPVPEITVVWK